MKLNNIVIDSLEYKNSFLYIFYKNYYGYEKYFNKVLILKDVKNFTYTIEELAYHTEMYGFLNDLELEAFTRVFYRNKKLNKLYIFDANYSMTIIEFSKKMNWRNQKRWWDEIWIWRYFLEEKLEKIICKLNKRNTEYEDLTFSLKYKTYK